MSLLYHRAGPPAEGVALALPEEGFTPFSCLEVPVLESTALTTHLLRTEYGLSTAILSPMRGGFLHPTWRAETAAGPLFIKRYFGPSWELDRVMETLAVQGLLVRQGHPVPALCANSAREYATTDPQGGTMVVMRFLPGTHRSPGRLSLVAAAAAGSELGRMHCTLQALQVTAEPFVPSTPEVQERAERLRAAAAAVIRPGPMDRFTIAACDYRLHSLRERPIDPGDYTGGLWQAVHGDYYPGNLLFDPHDQISAVVDFDFAGPRWRALEIGRAVVECGLDETGRFDPAIAQCLLAAYQHENPLPLQERRALFRIWYDYLLHSTYPLPLRYAREPLPHGWERLAERRHRLMVWLGDHLGELATLATQ